MESFLASLIVLCPVVNRAVEVFKQLLASQFPTLTGDTRSLLILVAQIVIALVTFVGTYAVAPVATGTVLDKYPVVVVALGTGLLALGSDAIYQLLEIAKRLKGPGAVG